MLGNPPVFVSGVLAWIYKPVILWRCNKLLVIFSSLVYFLLDAFSFFVSGNFAHHRDVAKERKTVQNPILCAYVTIPRPLLASGCVLDVVSFLLAILVTIKENKRKRVGVIRHSCAYSRIINPIRCSFPSLPNI